MISIKVQCDERRGAVQPAAFLGRTQKRWARVSGAGFFSLLWYVPLVLFHGPLATVWAACFVTLAQWLHLPLLSWLADTTIVPPVPSGTLLRWVLAYPLSGLLAILLEVVQPRTVWKTVAFILVGQYRSRGYPLLFA